MSSDSLSYLNILNCDLGHFDLSFLTGFHQLYLLSITNVSSIEKARWDLLPSLTFLNHFEIKLEKELQNDFNEWARKLRPLSNGLTPFICHAGVDDEAVDRLVQWLLNSSVETLKHLELQHTRLSRIPPGISHFQNLAEKITITCNESEINMYWRKIPSS